MIQKGPSKMAEGIAMHRAAESMLPEDERIFFDPYAFHFMNPEILKYAAEHPEEAKAKLEAMEKMLPGLGNSIRARVRYFDDRVEDCANRGFEQFVFLGAGYDTRALRFEELTSQVTFFEVDHPDTQNYKKDTVIEFYGKLPENVRYVPIDLERENLGERLLSHGYCQNKKTLFILEGLSMYLPPGIISDIYTFISSHSMARSRMLFDYFPESVINGTNPDEIAKNIIAFTRMNGEPLKFGIMDNREKDFLSQWGFENLRIITSKEYQRLYFAGRRENRQVCSLLSFIEVTIA